MAGDFDIGGRVAVILRMAGIFPDNDTTWLLPLLLIFYVGQMTSGVMLLITSGSMHLVAGIAIDVIGFPVGAEPGSVDPDKIFQLGLIEGPLSVIPALCVFIFYMRFNLTRARRAEIQALLAERAAGKT